MRLHLFPSGLTAGLLLVASGAHGAPVAFHSGATNPVQEGWALSSVGPGAQVSSGVESTASGAHAYWKVADATTAGGGSYYWPSPASLDYQADWTLKVTLRIVDAPPIPGYDGLGPMCILVRDGLNYWSWYLADDRVGPVGPGVRLARTLFLDTRGDYHSYEIRFFANGPATDDDSADFLVDGVTVFSGVTRSEMFSSADLSLNWGGCSSAGTGEANFESVVFDEASVVPAPSPTPSATPSGTPTATPAPSVTPTPDCDWDNCNCEKRDYCGGDGDGSDHEGKNGGHGIADAGLLGEQLLLSSGAESVPVAVHSGATDPQQEGWSLAVSGAGALVGPGIERTASGEHLFWRVADATTDGGGSYYWPSPSSLDFSSDWTFKAVLRILDAPPIPGYGDLGPMCLLVRDGVNYWSWYLADDRAGPLGPGVTLAQTYLLDTHSDYHSYEIRFYANGPGPDDDSADFLVDGTIVFPNVTRAGLFPSTDIALSWGGCSSVGTGVADFQSLVFAKPGIAPPAQPGEPKGGCSLAGTRSPFALPGLLTISIGLAAVLALRRRS